MASEKNMGSDFRFHIQVGLPIPAPPEVIMVPDVISSPVPDRPLDVLIVEGMYDLCDSASCACQMLMWTTTLNYHLDWPTDPDNLINQRVLMRQLNKVGFLTTVTSDGLEALGAIKQKAEKGEHFDTILMDLEMPVMDGLTAIRTIRALEAGGELSPKNVVFALVRLPSLSPPPPPPPPPAGLKLFLKPLRCETDMCCILVRYILSSLDWKCSSSSNRCCARKSNIPLARVRAKRIKLTFTHFPPGCWYGSCMPQALQDQRSHRVDSRGRFIARFSPPFRSLFSDFYLCSIIIIAHHRIVPQNHLSPLPNLSCSFQLCPQLAFAFFFFSATQSWTTSCFIQSVYMPQCCALFLLLRVPPLDVTIPLGFLPLSSPKTSWLCFLIQSIPHPPSSLEQKKKKRREKNMVIVT